MGIGAERRSRTTVGILGMTELSADVSVGGVTGVVESRRASWLTRQFACERGGDAARTGAVGDAGEGRMGDDWCSAWIGIDDGGDDEAILAHRVAGVLAYISCGHFPSVGRSLAVIRPLRRSTAKSLLGTQGSGEAALLVGSSRRLKERFRLSVPADPLVSDVEARRPWA